MFQVHLWAPYPQNASYYLTTTMQQPIDVQLAYKEGQLLLAKHAVDQGQIQARKRAAAVYVVPETTLRRRLSGIPSRRDCTPNSKKLTDLEELVIVQHILDLDS